MIPQQKQKSKKTYLTETLWNGYEQNNHSHFEKNFEFESTTAKIHFATEVVQIHCPDYHIEAQCGIQDLSIKVNLLEKDSPTHSHNVPLSIIEEIDYLYYKHNHYEPKRRFFN